MLNQRPEAGDQQVLPDTPSISIVPQTWARVEPSAHPLYDEVLAILFRHDPMGICAGDNTDEYDPETVTILPRLERARSVEDAQSVIHEQFVAWFDGRTAGPETNYAAVAADVWNVWQCHHETRARTG